MSKKLLAARSRHQGTLRRLVLMAPIAVVGFALAGLGASAGVAKAKKPHHQALQGSVASAHVRIVTVPIGGHGGGGDPGDDYPAVWRNAPQDSMLDQWREYNRECTSFAAWALASRNHFTMPFHDDAKNWGPDAQARGFRVDHTPAPGSIAWNGATPSSSWGHVAYVESVSGGSVYIEEYNHNFKGTYSSRTVPASSFTGYIHFADQLPSDPQPSGPPSVSVSANGTDMVVQVHNFPLGSTGYYCHVGDAAGYPRGGSIAQHGVINISSPDQNWSSGLCSGTGNFWIGLQATDNQDYYSNQVTLGAPTSPPPVTTTVVTTTTQAPPTTTTTPTTTAPTADTTPPSVPTGFTQIDNSQTAVRVAWNSSSDNVGVAGYDLYVNGSRVATGATSSYVIGGLTCSQSYTLGVDAYDAAGNHSAQATTTGTTQSCPAPQTWSETTGGVAHTWTDYNSAGGTQGPSISSNQTVQIACKVTGFRVQDGNTWWYRIASSPWNNQYYVSADAFYNNGATSGNLQGTPFVDPAVPNC